MGAPPSERLFVTHREGASSVEGGLAIRTTVQLNLFGGSVANLGDDARREAGAPTAHIGVWGL